MQALTLFYVHLPWLPVQYVQLDIREPVGTVPVVAPRSHDLRHWPRVGRGPGMISSRSPRTVTLRPWQKSALERFAACGAPDFLAVATPGAGKTTFALTAARQALAVDPSRRL